jgi:hypothetical protein
MKGSIATDDAANGNPAREGPSNFFVLQNGFLLPTFLFENDSESKISYDREITLDEIKEIIDYPEILDIPTLVSYGVSMSSFFNNGWLAKVENSTTGFRSRQANIIKVTNTGEIDWTKEYGYKAYIEPVTGIEKHMHWNGKIQQLVHYDNDLYMTGNMINTGVVKPNVFPSFSHYISEIALDKNIISWTTKQYGYHGDDNSGNVEITDSLNKTVEVRESRFEIIDKDVAN